MDHQINRSYVDGLKSTNLYQSPIPTIFKTYRNGVEQYLSPSNLSKLLEVSSGIKSIPEITADKLNSKDEDTQQLAMALLEAPDEKYAVKLDETEQSVVDSLDQSVNLELVKQFYELYYSPTGLKDVENRLGEVDMTLTNMHELRPEGASAVMGTDSDASWRTNINYMFNVDTGLTGANKYVYTSYAFAPMAPRNPSATIDDKQKLYSQDPNADGNDAYIIQRTDSEGNAVENTFNLDNLTYTGNTGTLRKPAFKSINDNINLVQFLMNKAFGIESTYINEWDLSMYMQEGVVDSQEQDDINHPGTKVYAPVFCTTLTFGLLNDTPLEQNVSGDPEYTLDDELLSTAVTFGSWNMAVSNRKGIDSITTSKACNLYNYQIAKYPLSKYWTPPTSGENLNYTTSYQNKTATDENGNSYNYTDTIYSDMNVSQYWDDLTAIRQSGYIWAEDAEATSGLDKYTPAHILGSNLYSAKWPFEFALKYADDKAAILSGWNSTDSDGKKINVNDKSNLCKFSNSMAYLPFYKQFFYNSGEGMEDLDQYWQSLNGDNQNEHSFLTCADEILEIIAADNAAFNSFKAAEQDKYDAAHPSSSLAKKNSVFNMTQSDGGGSEYGNISFRVPIVGKITIPHTKLLNMFLHKNEQSSKAMDKANAAKGSSNGGFLSSGTIGSAIGNSTGKAAVTTKDPEYKYNEATGEVEIISEGGVEINDTEEALGENLSYADGVNNNSPFLYGGPHGRFFSPSTLEGYCQPNNELLKIVPTMDTTPIYHGKNLIISNANSKSTNAMWTDSKNFKKGSFLSSRICMSLIERSNLLGLRRKVPVPNMVITYSGGYTVRYVQHSEAAWHWKFCWGWWHRHCWRFSFPKQIVAFNMDNWYWRWHWDWEYWDNASYWQTVSTTKEEPADSVFRDFTCERDSSGHLLDSKDDTGGFYITPVPRNWNPNMSQGKALSPYLDAQFNDLNKYPIVGDVNYAKQYANRSVKFLITPRKAYSVQVWDGKLYNPGCSSTGAFRDSMYNVWVATKNGSETFPVTLPIKDAKSGKVVCTIVGSAKVIRTRTSRVDYHWVPHWAWFTWYWSHLERHRRWWWTHCWRWCYHRSVFRYMYWTYEKYLNNNFIAYNILLDPTDLSQVIPSKDLIESSFPDYESVNAAGRDKTSTDIIDRWKVSAEVELSSFYPFSTTFMNKYGVTLSYLYGKNNYWESWNSGRDGIGANKALIADALVVGDAMQNYVNNNNKVIIRTATDYRFLYTKKDYAWTNQLKDTQWGWYIVDMLTHHDDRNETITMKSNYMIAQATGKTYSPALTKVLNEVPACPSILYLEEGDIATRANDWSPITVDNSKIKLYLYNNYDLFDSFIETCKSQIAFLKEVRDFANRYLSDDMIYSTYRTVTDPKILDIIDSVISGKADTNGIYYTGSYTEDINYFTALEILVRKFQSANQENVNYSALGTLSSYSNKTNSIYTLTQQRITDIEAIQAKAESIRKGGLTWDTLEQLSVLVSDSYGLINCANGARNWMFPNGQKTVYTSQTTGDSFMTPANSSTIRTYNLIDNPATLLWAYLNVLYQARKFYINKRLDKVQGSYWVLRAYERILTFQAARTTTTNKTQLLDKEVDPESASNKNKKIVFVESRTSQNSLATADPRDMNPDYTKAVYVRVNYISDSKFMESTKFNKATNKYNNQDYTYVDQVYKYAYKPEEGYYYIMSNQIKDNIKELFDSYTKKKADLKNGSYTFQVGEVALVNERLSKEEIDDAVLKSSNASDYLKDGCTADNPVLDPAKMAPLYLQYKNKKAWKTLDEVITYKEQEDNPDYIDLDTLEDNLKLLSTRLLKYYETLTTKLINQQLYKVYIDWDSGSRGVGCAIDKGYVTAANDTEHHFIDKHQYDATNHVYRRVYDSAGNVHTSGDPISSGITFNVADGANIGNLLNNYDKIGNFSAKELACSTIDTSDYWRIEVPNEYDIPTKVLEKGPVLVSNYAVELLLDSIKGKAVTPATVLTGVGRKLASPIKHHDASLLTAATATGLGEGVSLNSLGLEGIVPSDVESNFG